MADVLVRIFRWWFLFGAVCKAADAFWQTGVDKAGWLWVAVALVLCLRERAGYVAVALVGFGTALAGVENASHHVVAMAWVALPLALFADQAVARTALWSQTVVIYGFATVNKALFGFLTGGIIAEHAGIPLPSVVWPFAVAAVAAEGWLTWAVWARNRWALPVALGLHSGIVVWSGATSLINVGIAVMFNGLLVLMVWASSRPEVLERDASGLRPPLELHLVRSVRTQDRDDEISYTPRAGVEDLIHH